MYPQGQEKGCPPPPADRPYGFNPPPYEQAVYAPPTAPMGPVAVQYAQVPTTSIQVATAAIPPLGPESTHMVCPFCHAEISTKSQSESSTKTHVIALLLCLFGLWPCCLVPYCMDSCQNTNHYCPSCNAFLGQYKR